MLAVLMAAMSVGLTSCSKDDNKEPEIEISSAPIMGKWYYVVEGQIDTRYYIEFKTDNKFSYSSFNSEIGTISGDYEIISAEKVTFTSFLSEDSPGVYVEIPTIVYDATLFKMKISEIKGYSHLWVYHYYPSQSGDGYLIVRSFNGFTLRNQDCFRKTIK